MSESEAAGVRDFLVPDLGEGLEEATIVEWLVADGDQVALNQKLCIVETAKAEVDIPSPFAGTVVEHRGAPGDSLDVGALLVRIDTSAAGGTDLPKRQPTLVGYGLDEGADKSRRRPSGDGRASTTAPTTAPTTVPAGAKPLAKPPVRKLARQLGVDLGALAPGSGPGGIVTRSDVEAAAVLPAATDEVIPVRGVRARIAERMSTSHRQIPDATCAVEVDMARLLEVRVALDAAAGDVPVTPFAVLCHLLVQTLVEHRSFNATFVEDGPAIRLHGAVHLGVATATDRGLVVPVVRDADRLSTVELAARIAELAGAARSGSLPPTDLQGSTFTVSNFGALGLDDGIPVINYPEAAILGVGSVKERPFVVDGALAVRPTARLTLTFDHRVCDGAEAGAFMTSLCQLVQTPELARLHS